MYYTEVGYFYAVNPRAAAVVVFRAKLASVIAVDALAKQEACYHLSSSVSYVWEIRPMA